MPITSKPAAYYGRLFITRKVMNAFMDWISKRIYVERYNEEGLPFKYINVPIVYSTREYFYSLLKSPNIITPNSDPAIKLDLARILPRMAVNIVNMNYIPENNINKYQKVVAKTFTDGKRAVVMTPAPYRIDIELGILTKTTDDTFQIIEQLLPYFKPELSLDLNILKGFTPDSITFTLDSVNPDSTDEFGITDERIFTSILTFGAKANYYYIEKESGIIDRVLINYNLGVDDDAKKFKSYELSAKNLFLDESVEIQPYDTAISEGDSIIGLAKSEIITSNINDSTSKASANTTSSNISAGVTINSPTIITS